MKISRHLLLAHVCLSLIASAQTHFSETALLLSADDEGLNPPLGHIDVHRQLSSPIPDLESGRFNQS